MKDALHLKDMQYPYMLVYNRHCYLYDMNCKTNLTVSSAGGHCTAMRFDMATRAALLYTKGVDRPKESMAHCIASFIVTLLRYCKLCKRTAAS